MKKQKNDLGEDLESCSTNPITGWFRVGVAILIKKILACIPFV